MKSSNLGFKLFSRLFILTVCMLFTSQLYAQDKPTYSPEDVALKQTDMMKHALGLTEDQVAPVHDVNLSFAKKVEELIMGSQSKGDKMKEFKSLFSEKTASLKELLNDDQFAKYQTIIDKVKEESKKALENHIKQKAAGN